MTWLTHSDNVIAKGRTAKKAKSLADLAGRRRETEGQFFTPKWVAKGMFSIAKPVMDSVGRMVSLMDNSVGSGRLLANAEPSKHILYGCDVDHRVIDSLCLDAKKAGFVFEFIHEGVENIEASNIDVALKSLWLLAFITAQFYEAFPLSKDFL